MRLVPEKYLIVKNLNLHDGIRKFEELRIEWMNDPTLANKPTPKSQPRFDQ